MRFLVDARQRAAGVPNVPDHIIGERLRTLGYEERKISSLRAHVNAKLRAGMKAWGRPPYDVFECERANTSLRFTDQFARVLGLDQANEQPEPPASDPH